MWTNLGQRNKLFRLGLGPPWSTSLIERHSNGSKVLQSEFRRVQFHVSARKYFARNWRRRLCVFFNNSTYAFMLTNWGREYYTDWVVIMSFAIFFTMLDFGIQPVISNNCLKLARDDKNEELSMLIGRSLSLYIIVIPTVFLFSALIYLAAGGDGYIKTDVVSQTEKAIILFSLGLSFMMGNPIAIIGSVYAARGDVSIGIDRVSYEVLLQSILLFIILNLGRFYRDDFVNFSNGERLGALCFNV